MLIVMQMLIMMGYGADTDTGEGGDADGAGDDADADADGGNTMTQSSPLVLEFPKNKTLVNAATQAAVNNKPILLGLVNGSSGVR